MQGNQKVIMPPRQDLRYLATQKNLLYKRQWQAQAIGRQADILVLKAPSSQDPSTSK